MACAWSNWIQCLCNECGAVLSTKGNLKRHMKRHQPKVERLICGLCHITISNKWHMRVHYQRRHPRAKAMPNKFKKTEEISMCECVWDTIWFIRFHIYSNFYISLNWFFYVHSQFRSDKPTKSIAMTTNNLKIDLQIVSRLNLST